MKQASIVWCLQIGIKKCNIFLPTLIIIILVIVLCVLGVSAASFTPIYEGEGTPLSDEWSPTISLKLSNGTSIYSYSEKTLSLQDKGSLIFSLSVSAGKSPNGRSVGLFEVSYNASWLYPVVLYHWNGNPADFNELSSAKPYFQEYNLTFTSIPKGNQSIVFKVTSIGMYLGIPYFSFFRKEAAMTLELSVGNPAITKDTVPDNLTVINAVSVILILVVVVAVFLLYQRKR